MTRRQCKPIAAPPRCLTGRLVGETTVGEYAAVIPEITGRAWITGTAEYRLDADDPFPAGFAL